MELCPSACGCLALTPRGLRLSWPICLHHLLRLWPPTSTCPVSVIVGWPLLSEWLPPFPACALLVQRGRPMVLFPC